MDLKRVTKVGLGFLMTLGVAALVHPSPTFALFASQTTNPANTFQAGTLRLSNSRAGASLFLSTANGDVTPSTSITLASGTTVLAPGLNAAGGFSVTTGTMSLSPGLASQVTGLGGLAPGHVMTNSLTVGNVGTLSAGRVVLSVPAVTLVNPAAQSCDNSTVTMVGLVDVCGRGRLTDVLRVTAFYLTGEGSAVCVLGPNPGALVPAQTDTDALLGCASSTLGVPLTQSVSGQTLPLAASPDPLVLVSSSVLDERINPALATGTLVRNYRNGVTVDDWESGRTRTITFVVAVDPQADNRYQGSQAVATLTWTSTSLSGAPAGSAP